MTNEKLRLVGSDKVKLDVYPRCKYEGIKENEIKVVELDGVEAFEVIAGENAKEVEAETDGSCIDDYHEYLRLYFENGETATFRNSYVDMFHM